MSKYWQNIWGINSVCTNSFINAWSYFERDLEKIFSFLESVLQYTIAQKMADQGRSDFDVVYPDPLLR